MTKEELIVEYLKLYRCDTINDSYDLIDIYSDFFLKVIVKYQMVHTGSNSLEDAKILFQMMYTKILHIKQVVEGISHTTKDKNLSLKGIIDPTVVGCLIRNVYETVSTFNLIYINESDEEKKVLYNLWCISGLKNRQKFESYTKALERDEILESDESEESKILKEQQRIQTLQNKKKFEFERKQILKYLEEIKQTDLYKNLSTEGITEIEKAIKKKDYKVKFQDNKVTLLIWQDLRKQMQIKDGLMDDIYTYFSLYSHPSNVSVFQFSELFKEKYFFQMTNFQLKNLFMLLSTFIADYIKLFPPVLNVFNELSILDQIVIDAQNIFARGYEFSINDSYKKLI